MREEKICIIGTGPVGTACALRLFRAGFPVIMVEKQPPLDIYQHSTFSSAYFSGRRTIDEITARTLPGAIEAGMAADIAVQEFILYQIKNREIALLTTEQASFLKTVQPAYAVYSNSSFHSEINEHLPDECTLITLGQNPPGESRYRIADNDLYLGRVEYPFLDNRLASGASESSERKNKEFVRAPLGGVFTSLKQIGDAVYEKEEIGRINDIPILAPLSGWIAGLLNSGLLIPAKTVFAEIHKASKKAAKIIEPQAFAIAGGVLEAILYDINLKTSV